MAEVGTTTFRPPYTPISFGSIAGRETGNLFKPVRQTAMHHWHAAHGAEWEPVGDWRRPYRYQRGNEDRDSEVSRPDVHQHDVDVEARQMSLRPDEQ